MHPEQSYQTPNTPSPYDFIVNPPQPQKQNPFTGGSVVARVGLVLGGLLLLLVAFVVIKNLLTSGSSNTAALLTVLSQQQELVHITNPTSISKGSLSEKNRIVAATVQLSVASSQKELTAYMKLNGVKVEPKQLIYPQKKAIDAQLTTAIAASTFNTVYEDVLETQLTDYQQSLKTAFNKTGGTKGRELLTKQYDGATLLIKQLSAAD